MDIVERLRNEPELTPAQYWEAQADMWHQNYKEATNEIEQLRKDYALAWENHLLHEQIFVLTEAKIEQLREALQLIAAPSKIIAKGEDMAVALQVLLSSHRQTALDALGEKD